MGDVTPRFALRFPFQSEVITPAHFKNLADDLDGALGTVYALRDRAVKRPTASVTGPIGGGGATTVPPSTVTVLTIGGGTGSTVNWDNDAMKAGGVHDRLTVKTAGLWEINASTQGSFTAATTLNCFEMQLNIAGVKPKVFNHKKNTETQADPGWSMVTGVWPLAVNDYVQVRAWWNGTGTLTPVGVTLAMRLISLP